VRVEPGEQRPGRSGEDRGAVGAEHALGDAVGVPALQDPAGPAVQPGEPGTHGPAGLVGEPAAVALPGDRDDVRGAPAGYFARDLRDRRDDRVQILLHPVIGGVDEFERTARDGQGLALVVEQGGLHHRRPGVDAEPGASHDLSGTVCP
jgi:hypothetical protein